MLAAVTDVLQNLSGLIQEKCMCHQHPVQYLFALLIHSSTKVDRGPAIFKTCAFWACLCIDIQQADGNRGSTETCMVLWADVISPTSHCLEFSHMSSQDARETGKYGS